MSEITKFLQTLFNETDSICTGTTGATQVRSLLEPTEGEFFCINPLHPSTDHNPTKPYHASNKPRRSDLNVTEYRNFMFEMDSVPLADQYTILRGSGILWSTIVHSGGKSYHAILSLANALPLEPHKQESIDTYKLIWKRLQALIDLKAQELGFLLPENKKSFVDPTSINPSRLSRTGGALRDGEILQSILCIEDRIKLSDFYMLLDRCPIVSMPGSTSFTDFEPTGNTILFEHRAEESLTLMLKNPGKWGASEGMYPILFRLTLWAIDSTNVTKDVLLEYMTEHTFPRLIELNYPENKLTKPVDHAYILKGK